MISQKKIQIIGLGVVGTAQAYLAQKLGHKVFGYDIVAKESPYCEVVDDYIVDADVTFICTNESTVEDVVEQLNAKETKSALVIRSTTPPGTTKHLSEKWGLHISHNPEFLREKTYLSDILRPSMIVIGRCCQEHGAVLESFYEPLNVPIFLVDQTTSELVKLALNNYLSTLITFWNEIDEVCSVIGVDIMTVAEITKRDQRVSHYGNSFFGKPFSGMCLPKDLNQIIQLYRSNNLNPKLFEACRDINHLMEKRI
jgi:nucleotide sugar dehydrogenase